MRWVALLTLLWLVLLVVGVRSCTGRGWPYVIGDLAQEIRYDNQLDESVAITYRFDGSDRDEGGVTISPHSRRTEDVMLRSTGFTLRATTASGVVVVDRHYLWKDLEKVRRLDIVIGP